jgi:hypothetical protein
MPRHSTSQRNDDDGESERREVSASTLFKPALIDEQIRVSYRRIAEVDRWVLLADWKDYRAICFRV